MTRIPKHVTHPPLGLLDSRALRRVDLFFFVLMDAVADTLLPEIVEVFGHEAMFKFLNHFAGMTIQVPNRVVIERSVRDTSLFHELDRIDRSDAAAVGRVAQQYGRTVEDAMVVYHRLRRLLRRMQSVSRRGKS